MAEDTQHGQTTVINALAEVADSYDALLCDLWGCYHNGVTPYPAAVAALRAFRARGGVVILLTNAPRPSSAVKIGLDRMGAPEDTYDRIVSSGDATRAALASGAYGRRFHIVGPDKDLGLMDNLDIETTTLDQAEAILCTGLYDDSVETPADYVDFIAAARARDLPLLCANPDIVVDRGDRRLYCAGAIAAAYTEAGGRSFYFGKPHPPAYALARAAIGEVLAGDGRTVESSRILALGDGVLTDVPGAARDGVDCVFVSGGLAAEEVGDDPERPEPERLHQYLVAHGVSPRYTIGRLR